ncbi:uncharacterized protein UMAG_05376 [Mycosarcoma maydis]|uniref:Transcriptional regulatory protein DEP1 n=1 Tax=Mycosarcoma maydis TaxID=5270 RepID=A0A0D1BWL5_MYCMD|nr:uncharacterized protein UMAG_05376 [Ustilago maydis 521]KIS66382.1 hypothetical protein UMAG_05376 [Ustilago maydis 521]|eukprot:XP_011392071.1 hypothetical protein UMAG_05376 [Ustilago maydis 521]
MPSSAATAFHIAAAAVPSAATTKHSQHDPADNSDAETEPLPYDDDDNDQDAPADDVMDLDQLAQHAAASAAIPTDQDALGEPEDISMDQSQDSQLEPSQAEDLADLPTSQQTAAQDPNSNMSSPQKTGGFTGDEFSDESELTDEDDDHNQDEDGSSLSDDDLGGSEDDEEEEEEEEEDEEQEDDDEQDANKTHEDEAAEALAALTGGAEGADQDADAAAGLDALAALATADHAENDQNDQDEDDVSEPEAEEEDTEPAAGSLDGAAMPGRVQLLRHEADDDGLSSDITPEPEDGDAADALAEDASDQEHTGSHRDTNLDMIASMKKRAAATGGATSLLEPEQLVDSLPGSASSSRAPSPLADDDDDAEMAEHAEDADADADVKAPQADQAEAEQPDTAAGTPAPDAAEHDDETSTDEAAIRRQEAMEALTKIEIGFAMLRDRLYVERLQEISKEGDMILDGTHPELLHLTKAIEMRRQRRTELVEMWFEQQEMQYERVAKAEEFAAWSIWRSSCASLRRDMMDEFSRKRRRLDREKRTLDAPRPARRHQIFETELVRNPDRLHIPLNSSTLAEDAEATHANGSKAARKPSTKRKALAREIEAGDEFVAYPDLKGLAEADVMMDIEQMGIRPVGVPPGMYDPFYGAPVGLEFQNPEMYALYGPDAAAAAAATAAAAQAHINGMPYNLPPGARGLPPPPPGAMMAPGTPGSVHEPHRHGMHALPPPSGHMHPGMEMGMMAFDPYAAAEMERAARMHHREQQARMGLDPHDPHHRSSPFPPDMYAPYPPHFNVAPGAAVPGPGMRAGMPNMPPSPTPPHRVSGGRKERGSIEDGISVSVSGRGRGGAKTSGRSKQPRSNHARDTPTSSAVSIASPAHAKTSSSSKTNLPPPPSMPVGTVGSVDERDHKALSNGASHRAPAAHRVRHPIQQQQPAPAPTPAFAGARKRPSPGPNVGLQIPSGPPAATPVAAAAATGVGNRNLYPSD